MRVASAGRPARGGDVPADLGSRLGQANALIYLGGCAAGDQGLSGRGRDLKEALDIYRDLGYRLGEAKALNDSGALRRASGDLGQAWSCHQQALDLARQMGAAPDEARARVGTGPLRPGRRPHRRGRSPCG